MFVEPKCVHLLRNNLLSCTLNIQQFGQYSHKLTFKCILSGTSKFKEVLEVIKNAAKLLKYLKPPYTANDYTNHK